MNMDDSNNIFKVLRQVSRRSVIGDYGIPNIANAEPAAFSKNNFHSLDMAQRKLCFVDGGNNTVYLAPGHSLQLVRLYYSIFDGDNKVEEHVYTYVVDGEYIPEDRRYIVDVYDLDNTGLYEPHMYIPEAVFSEEKIKGVGAYIRRIGEWLLMERVADKCDYVVHDGALQTGEREEYRYQERVFSKVRGIIGLSKTCTLMTTKGVSIVAAVHHLANRHGINAPWYYYPVARNISTIRGDMFIVKLHPASRYAFRTEVYSKNDAENDILSALVSVSNDALFVGYPYGLLDADIHARVTDEEIKMYQGVVYENLDDFSMLEMNAVNAHDVISEVK